MVRRHTLPFRGFTLMEMMIVVAIIGILAAMSVAAYGSIGTRSAPQNAGHDFYSALTRAKARALERSSDVWVIIYPDIDKSGATGGHGAWFLYEDADGNFLNAGTLKWSTFSPPGGMTPGENDRLLEANYLDDYQGKNVMFGPVTGVSMQGPFSALTVPAEGCTFCTAGTPKRGAVVFTADGTARFVNNAGATTSARTAALGMRASQNASIGYQFGVARATGFITTFK